MEGPAITTRQRPTNDAERFGRPSPPQHAGKKVSVDTFPRTEIGLTTEAKESTESGEVGIPLRTLQILCVLCGSISDLGLR